jgi:colanic acid/amylovoran biosynthesis glycosyltransferase
VASRSDQPRLCIVQPQLNVASETFLRAHAERLPADVQVIHLTGSVPQIGSEPIQSPTLLRRMWRETCRTVLLRSRSWKLTPGILQGLQQHHSEAVLAEYGPTGVLTQDACRLADIPLIVHFHGYDASMKSVVKKYAAKYRRLFGKASAVIASSEHMRNRLIGLGADPAKTHLNIYGVDCKKFCGSRPAENEPIFIAVGRFVEKKSPDSTIRAFAEVWRNCPRARLRMIGDGPLLAGCKKLAADLGIGQCVEFLGAQPHEVVSRQMQKARAFVQHSVETAAGDCEGTPVSILEAGAVGLPVVVTRHAGIPDVVQDGRTGFLVDEHDIAEMARRMLQLAQDAELAGRMGQAAREHVTANFSIEQSIDRLWSIIQSTLHKSAA